MDRGSYHCQAPRCQRRRRHGIGGVFCVRKLVSRVCLGCFSPAVSWLAVQGISNLCLLWIFSADMFVVLFVGFDQRCSPQRWRTATRIWPCARAPGDLRFVQCVPTVLLIVSRHQGWNMMKLCYAFVFTLAFFVVGCVGSIKSMGRGFQTPLVAYPKSSHQSSHQSHHIQKSSTILETKLPFQRFLASFDASGGVSSQAALLRWQTVLSSKAGGNPITSRLGWRSCTDNFSGEDTDRYGDVQTHHIIIWKEHCVF